MDDVQTFLRLGQVAHVAQAPRVMSGSSADNIRLDHDRAISQAIDRACLAVDVEEAGGVDTHVGHRGVRLSGGKGNATTEVQLWDSLRAHRTTTAWSHLVG